ncbi:MAG: hypothetical protein KF726_00070 [Anaerolineae bacterium]|nr:hypothetical protein [Anaerolineae bacterium]
MTAQLHEILIYEGAEMSMAFCPPIPTDHPRIKRLTAEEIKDEPHHPFIFSTACWRRYVGTWEIRDWQFYLVKLVGIYKVIGDEPIPATWFTGVIRVPRGEMLHYVHMGFGSVYEQELHMKIEAGEVVRSRVIDNRNKDIDNSDLGFRNLPGFENQFDGDDEI